MEIIKLDQSDLTEEKKKENIEKAVIIAKALFASGANPNMVNKQKNEPFAYVGCFTYGSKTRRQI